MSSPDAIRYGLLASLEFLQIPCERKGGSRLSRIIRLRALFIFDFDYKLTHSFCGIRFRVGYLRNCVSVSCRSGQKKKRHEVHIGWIYIFSGNPREKARVPQVT